MAEGEAATMNVSRKNTTAVVSLAGDWIVKRGLPDVEVLEKELKDGQVKTLEFETAKLGRWDSGLLAFLVASNDLCNQLHIQFKGESLPEGVQKLIRLSQAVPEKEDARREEEESGSLFHTVGEFAIQAQSGIYHAFNFIGETVLAGMNLIRGKAQFRWPDSFVVMQEVGPEALGVVALINFLVGVILAFVGAVQLRQFGASIYVADLVAIGTVREMGCLMTGIILSGRTGAAFAAQLGTMKVNEEIDAFKTFGISPIEFLVLPRIVALLLMMPLLCVFADAIALLGGFVVSVSMLDVTIVEYFHRSVDAITLSSFFLGIFKGGFFGILVAMTGCLRGIQCGNNAAAVGQAATSAVVTGITSIIAADGIFAVLCNALKI
jgi:phospholipid/cholesterol/gamma-HCH transport system permease protein